MSLSLLSLALSACSLPPLLGNTPAMDLPSAFKEQPPSHSPAAVADAPPTPGDADAVRWLPVAPPDAAVSSPVRAPASITSATSATSATSTAWWTVFGDPLLNDLAARVEAANPSVAVAVAAYDQARAVTAQRRASLFPVVGLQASTNRDGGGGDTPTRRNYAVNIGASWEPDLFGRLRLGIEGARLAEQASLADLANVRLALQGELAVNYFNLRGTDAQLALQRQTLAGYARSLQIVGNRYEAGIVARTDVLQAQTQHVNAQADVLALERQRAELEHAIAVLVGQAPANFDLPALVDWQARVPDVPVGVPSMLLQRRPDIVAAQRRVAQANAQLGLARVAYFPSLQLTGSLGSSAARLGDLFKASSLAWAVGASLAQALFDGGAVRAQLQGAQAEWRAAAARYRQTVLTAFQDVEDQLVAARTLQQQEGLRQQAAEAAGLAEQQVLNRYQAGQVGYTEVVTAQATAASARRALVDVQTQRRVAAAALVQALGANL